MSVSLEALAMAGASGVECAMDIEEWERNDLEQYPPPHLLAEDEEEEEENSGTRRCMRGHGYGVPTSHFLLNYNKREHHDKQKYHVTFNSEEEKIDTTMQRRRPKRTRSMKIVVRALVMLIKILSYKHKKLTIIRNLRH